MSNCYVCSNPALVIVYNSLINLKEQEKEHPELKDFTFKDYISYVCSEEVFTEQYQYDYFSQKLRLLQVTTFKFRNQMNVITQAPCSTEHADIIEVLAKEKYIAIKPRNNELFGSLDSWGNDWRKGY